MSGADFRPCVLAVCRNSASELRGLLVGLLLSLDILPPSRVEHLDLSDVLRMLVSESLSSTDFLRRVMEGRASDLLDCSSHRVSSARRVLSSFKYSKSCSSSPEQLVFSQSVADVTERSFMYSLAIEIDSGCEELFVMVAVVVIVR